MTCMCAVTADGRGGGEAGCGADGGMAVLLYVARVGGLAEWSDNILYPDCINASVYTKNTKKWINE